MRDKYYAGSGTLKRSLRLFYVYAIATGAIFTFMAYWDGFFLTTTGPFTFIGFGLMMIAVLPIGFVYAEWATMCPTAGVELVYGTVGLNKHAGFWSTWLILAAWLAVPPAGVLGIISWIDYMFELNLSIGWIALISCIVLVLYTLLSLQNITISGQVQTFMLLFGFTACIIGSILWITSDAWSWDNFDPFIQSGLSHALRHPGGGHRRRAAGHAVLRLRDRAQHGGGGRLPHQEAEPGDHGLHHHLRPALHVLLLRPLRHGDVGDADR